MKKESDIVHLRPSQRGALHGKAEIIPNEPGRVMLPRDCARRILEFHRFYRETKSSTNKNNGPFYS